MSAARPGLVVWGGLLLALVGLLLRYAGPLGRAVGREWTRFGAGAETVAFAGTNRLYAAGVTVVAGDPPVRSRRRGRRGFQRAG